MKEKIAPITDFPALMNVCVGVRERLEDIAMVHAFSNATFSELSSECFTFHAALLQVQAVGWYRDRLERLQQGSELANAFDRTLDDSAITLSNLMQSLDDIRSKAESQSQEADVAQLMAEEFNYLWEESTITTFVERLRKQQSELQYLLLAFHS